MAVNFFAPMARFRNLVVTDGGSISSDNGILSSNGLGTWTVGQDVYVTSGASVQTVATGNTVTVGANITVNKVTTGGAVTGVIMPVGTTDGQTVTVLNTSANSVTMAAAGTSHVADGASCVIPANRQFTFTWESTGSLWYH